MASGGVLATSVMTTTTPAPRQNEVDKLVLHQDNNGISLDTALPDGHKEGLISDSIPFAKPLQEIQSKTAIGPSSPSDDPSPVTRQGGILPPLSTTSPRDNTTQKPCPPPLSTFRLTQIQRDQWSAARILNENKISACLAGSPVSNFYGSDDLWVWVPALVDDAFLNSACEVLIKHGYEDISDGQGGTVQDFQAPEKNEDGTEAVNWRFFCFPPHSNGAMNGTEMVKVILIPSSHWHFEITEETTFLVGGIPVPKVASYIHALTSLLANRLKSGQPTGYYHLQLLSVWILRSKYPTELEDLPLADKFFIEKYPTLKRRPNKKKLVELWEKLTKGEMEMKEAEEKVPVEWRPPPRQEIIKKKG